MADEDDSEGSVYEESREGLVDDDEISPEEEGFMMGYDEAEAEKKEKVEKEPEEPEES